MAELPQSIRRGAHAALAGLALAVLPATGCVTPSTSFSFFHDAAAETPTKVVGFWDRNVRLARDCVHNGAELPGLAGRVYLFGPDETHTIVAHGKVIVDWYDVSGPADAVAKPLGRCVYDSDNLQKMKRKDFLGIGYTLFLDWPSYRPDISRVRVHMCFVPNKGFPLYADPSIVSLQGDTPVTSHTQVIPASQLALPTKQ